jgi:hypothetical protein
MRTQAEALLSNGRQRPRRRLAGPRERRWTHHDIGRGKGDVAGHWPYSMLEGSVEPGFEQLDAF